MSITAPRTAGFVTRAQAGLRRPRSVSRNITPSRGGVAFHYGGADVPVSNHAQCLARWKSWQNYHMDHHGWVDIAYSMGICQHGYVFAGRGAGARTAANGSNHGNQTHYAVCWIGGARQTPTSAALSAFAWCVNELRNSGGAGRSVKPHQFFKATSCPGSALVRAARQIDGKDLGSAPPAQTHDEWEVFWMSLTSKERTLLKQFAAELAGRDGVDNGASFAKQFLLFNRNERPQLQSFLDEIKRLDSSAIGQVRSAVTLWREAGARGWKRDTESVKRNKHYSSDELGLDESL